MPVPAQLHEILTQAYPELIPLEPEQLRQLEVYLEAPDRFQTKLSQVQRERRQGKDDHLRKKRQHEEFHQYLKRVAAYNRNQPSSTSNTPSAATEALSDQSTGVQDDFTIEGAFRCAVGILRTLETLKQMADEHRPPHRVEGLFDQLCLALRGLDLALSTKKIGDAFIQARLPVDPSSNPHRETRSWHHSVFAIGLDWYQQIFKVVDGALLLQLRLTQLTGFRYDELPGSRVADGWRPVELIEGMYELRPGDRDPTANVERRLQGMPPLDFDQLLMMLDKERAISSRNEQIETPTIVSDRQVQSSGNSSLGVEVTPDTTGAQQTSQEPVGSDKLVVKRATFSVEYKRKTCVLKNTNEFAVIERLNQCPGDYLPVQTLIDDVWGDSQTGNQTVQSTISSLRKKIREAGIQNIEIDGKTNYGHYALILS